MENLLQHSLAWVTPVLGTLFVLWLVIVMIRLLHRRLPRKRVERQILQLLAVVIAIAVLVLILPVSDTTQGQLLSLLGIVITAVIGLASTTFVSNAMAGFMLRSVASFHGGDFIRVGKFFGRVTETALFHTEIQNQDRDLVTMPNLYLITHPVEVVRASGTLIAANVSLGYDVHRRRVRDLLVQAAQDADLTDAFVQITELGDHAVHYRVSGFLSDVSSLLSSQTALRANMLDRLHEDGIEIVSPQFMNQRPLSADERMIPAVQRHGDDSDHDGRAEQLMFDKAEVVGRIQKLNEQRDRLLAEIADLDSSKDAPAHEVGWRQHQLASIDEILASLDLAPGK